MTETNHDYLSKLNSFSNKRLLRKEYFSKWKKQMYEYLGYETILEYLVPDFEKFNTLTNNYQSKYYLDSLFYIAVGLDGLS
jgi:hypothetical protein